MRAPLWVMTPTTDEMVDECQHLGYLSGLVPQYVRGTPFLPRETLSLGLKKTVIDESRQTAPCTYREQETERPES